MKKALLSYGLKDCPKKDGGDCIALKQGTPVSLEKCEHLKSCDIVNSILQCAHAKENPNA